MSPAIFGRVSRLNSEDGTMRVGIYGLTLVGVAALSLQAEPVWAQSRAETLRYVTGASVNTLDPNVPGSTREAFAVSLSTYDRLVSFGRKQLNGKWVFDLGKITGELAESYEVSPDGLKLTFHLRKDAKFQDGSPVTAEDVKWSLDRAVTAPVLGKAQLLTGSLTSADQFKVVDPLTFEVTLPKPDKLALPNLATVYPIIINSTLARANATADDPWAITWLKEHTAGSGAYIIESFKPGEQVIMKRSEAWNRGTPLFGAEWVDGKPTTSAFPFPQPVKLDLDKAREYLKAAGMPDGFSTTFSFNVGQASTAEPMAALVKESLGKIGIKVEIQKLPDAQMSTQINEKKLPFFTEGIVAWLPSTDYFYRNFYTGNQRWNYASIDNPELTALAQQARFESDKTKYDEESLKLNAIHVATMPQIALWQPSQDAVMAKSVGGYTYQFHRQVDYRDLSRK
jgi:ABC-type transport system substrate-binding protein